MVKLYSNWGWDFETFSCLKIPFFSFELDFLGQGVFLENPILGSLAAVVARLCKKVVLRAAFQIT